MIRFEFLGTSAGTPTKNRNVSALALSCQNEKSWILIDCGEATQHQLLHSSHSLVNLSHIFITHLHGDHIFGLPGLLSTRSSYKCSQDLTIVGPKGIKNFILSTLSMSFSQYHGKLIFIEIENPEDLAISTPAWKISCFSLHHNIPSYAYIFEKSALPAKILIEKTKAAGLKPGPIFQKIKQGENVYNDEGKLFESKQFLAPKKDDLKIIICGDNASPSLLKPYLDDLSLLIHEATYTKDDLIKLDRTPLHTCLEEILETADEYSLKNLILTHFSPRYEEKDKNINFMCSTPSIFDKFKGNLHFAHDFSVFKLDQDGILTLD